MDAIQPSNARDKKNAAFTVKRIQTGWEVSRGWEERTEGKDGRFNYDFLSETYAYPTLEEALDKIQSLA